VPPVGRGLRILCLDGGGSAGIATVQYLKEVEKTVGCEIRDYFDLICGTSAGSILAMGLSIFRCERHRYMIHVVYFLLTAALLSFLT